MHSTSESVEWELVLRAVTSRGHCFVIRPSERVCRRFFRYATTKKTFTSTTLQRSVFSLHPGKDCTLRWKDKGRRWKPNSSHTFRATSEEPDSPDSYSIVWKNLKTGSCCRVMPCSQEDGNCSPRTKVSGRVRRKRATMLIVFGALFSCGRVCVCVCTVRLVPDL